MLKLPEQLPDGSLIANVFRLLKKEMQHFVREA